MISEGARTVVKKVSAFARKFIDSRTNKFIEVGYVTSCMELTSKGVEALHLIALDKWGDELEAAADAEIAAAEKKN
jgi:hypothetical protein